MNYRPQLSPPAGPDALSRWVWARQQVRAWCSVHRAPIQIQKPAIEASRRALDAGHRPETLPIGDIMRAQLSAYSEGQHP